MRIEGPLKIGSVETDTAGGRELHLDFTDEFRNLALSDQAAAFADYITRLKRDIGNLPEESRDGHGMLTVLQIAEELLPHIIANEVPLNETIVVEIGPEDALSSLMTGGTSH